jgi:hypothetical protein
MRMFQKNTKTCDHCGCSINPKADAALCLHGEEHGIPFEQWICEPCCLKVAYEYEQYFELEDATVAEENRNNYPE